MIKYNEYDVDTFYDNVRSINTPNSEVLFSPNQISDDSLFTILATNIDSDIDNLYNIPGYAIYSKLRNRHGGEVVMCLINILHVFCRT